MTEVDLDLAAFERWLRAQRPPLEWFLQQSVTVQETLARCGDSYVTDQVTAVAIALGGVDPQPPDMDLVEELTRRTTESILGQPAGSSSSFAGTVPAPEE